MRGPINDPSLKALAKALILEGRTPTSIARELGTTQTTIRCWTDPDYNFRRREQVNRPRGYNTVKC